MDSLQCVVGIRILGIKLQNAIEDRSRIAQQPDPFGFTGCTTLLTSPEIHGVSKLVQQPIVLLEVESSSTRLPKSALNDLLELHDRFIQSTVLLVDETAVSSTSRTVDWMKRS